MANRRKNITRPILRRPAKAVLPPDVVDGGTPDRPILMRQSVLRYAYRARKIWKGKPVKDGWWQSLIVGVPREIIETAGWEPGMTLVMEAYVDGRVRMYPAGDVVSREEELV